MTANTQNQPQSNPISSSPYQPRRHETELHRTGAGIGGAIQGGFVTCVMNSAFYMWAGLPFPAALSLSFILGLSNGKVISDFYGLLPGKGEMEVVDFDVESLESNHSIPKSWWDELDALIRTLSSLGESGKYTYGTLIATQHLSQAVIILACLTSAIFSYQKTINADSKRGDISRVAHGNVPFASTYVGKVALLRFPIMSKYIDLVNDAIEYALPSYGSILHSIAMTEFFSTIAPANFNLWQKGLMYFALSSFGGAEYIVEKSYDRQVMRLARSADAKTLAEEGGVQAYHKNRMKIFLKSLLEAPRYIVSGEILNHVFSVFIPPAIVTWSQKILGNAAMGYLGGIQISTLLDQYQENLGGVHDSLSTPKARLIIHLMSSALMTAAGVAQVSKSWWTKKYNNQYIGAEVYIRETFGESAEMFPCIKTRKREQVPLLISPRMSTQETKQSTVASRFFAWKHYLSEKGSAIFSGLTCRTITHEDEIFNAIEEGRNAVFSARNLG